MDKKRKWAGEEEEEKELISSIDDGKIQSLNQKEEPEKKIELKIAPPAPQSIQINSKYMKFLNDAKEENNSNSSSLPSNSLPKTEDEIAAEELMKQSKEKGELVEVDGDSSLPLLIKFRNPQLDDIQDEAEKLKYDIETRPETSSMEQYDALPVDSFGAAYLRGLGWNEGTPIGKTNAAVFKPVEFKKKNQAGSRTGLAAKPSDDFVARGQKPPNPNQKERERKEMEKKEREKFSPGTRVEIVGGKHSGLLATFLSRDPNGDFNLKLSSSSQNVKVSEKNVVTMEEKAKRREEDRNNDRNNDGNDRNSSSKSSNSKSSNSKSSSSSSSSSSGGQTWLNPGLVVKIVSKDFKEGAYYLKKGIIMDVLTQRECTVRVIGESKRTVEVKRSMLETVIPKPDERIMIVRGPDYGSLGIFKQKNKYKDRSVAVIQLADDLEYREYELDDVCQYNPHTS